MRTIAIVIALFALIPHANAQQPLSEKELAALLDPPAQPLPKDVSAAMAAASSFTLYSLDPDVRVAPAAVGTFHGYHVLGQTRIVDAPTRQRVAATITESVAHTRGLGMGCFIPHHGLHFAVGKRVYDLVICFHCEHVSIYATGHKLRETRISTGAAVLDAIFVAANIPMAERRK